MCFRTFLLLATLVGVAPARAAKTIEGLPHPDPNTWPRTQMAQLIQYAPFAFGGADSPNVVLYDDGTILRGELSRSGEMTYLVSILKVDELRYLRESIGPLTAFRALKDSYNLAPDMADVPDVGLILSDGSGLKSVDVAGYSLYGWTPPGSMTRMLRADALPREFDRLCKLLLSVKPRNAVPWTPKYVEVRLRPTIASPDPALHWPATWPALSDRLAFRHDDNTLSLILSGSHLQEMRTLIDHPRTAIIDGKWWVVSWLPVIPGSTMAKRIEMRLQAAQRQPS
jgi:hypothetical protein